jgi:death-on-curing protein
MKEAVWLNRADCLAIQEMMLAQHGGLAGVRDEGLLESALAKPQNQFAYGSPSLTDLAASFAAGVIHNHPVLDGNKRAGFMLAATFLELNGLVFTASEESVADKTMALAASELNEAGYALWLKANSRKA